MSHKFKLSQLKESLSCGYLPSDFIQQLRDGEKLVWTESGYCALQCDTIETEEGDLFHEQEDRDEYSYDDFADCYINECNAVTCYGRRGRECISHVDRCIQYNGDYYHEDYLESNDIVCMYNGRYNHVDYCRYVQEEGEHYPEDQCYYWESDGEYHLTEEAQKNTLFGYSAGPREKCFLYDDKADDQKNFFGWGIEIEKNEMPDFDFDKHELYDNTGAVIEEDGSVSDGFELKTPIYNLFAPKTLERLEALKDFCNVKNIEGAGGHIGFSMDGKSDEQLLDLCRGFLPLIYAMHKKRIHNTFCTCKKINDLKNDGAKYQSIRLRGNYIEFRIFGAVRSFNTILFRLDLFKIIASNLGANFGKVLLMAVNINHPLNKLLCRVYDNKKKFMRLIEDSYLLDQSFGAGRLTSASLSKILQRLDKVFVAPEIKENGAELLSIPPVIDGDFNE